jgi:hypothetical protein
MQPREGYWPWLCITDPPFASPPEKLAPVEVMVWTCPQSCMAGVVYGFRGFWAVMVPPGRV